LGAHCFVVALDVAFEYSVLATLYAFGLIRSKLVLSILTNTLSQDSLAQHTGSLDGRVEQILRAKCNIIASIMRLVIRSSSLLRLFVRVDFVYLLNVLELIILLLLHIYHVVALIELLLLLAVGSLLNVLLLVLFILIGHQHNFYLVGILLLFVVLLKQLLFKLLILPGDLFLH